jgi:hypothetical protein
MYSLPIAVPPKKYTDNGCQCYTPDYCWCGDDDCSCKIWHNKYWNSLRSQQKKKPIKEKIADAIKKRTDKQNLRAETTKSQLHKQRRACAKPDYVDFETYCDAMSSIFVLQPVHVVLQPTQVVPLPVPVVSQPVPVVSKPTQLVPLPVPVVSQPVPVVPKPTQSVPLQTHVVSQPVNQTTTITTITIVSSNGTITTTTTTTVN